MKLFIRDHLDIVALYALVVGALSLAYHGIDGFREGGGVAYFLFLSAFLLLLTLLLRYYRKRRLYRALSARPDALEDMVGAGGTDAVEEAFFRRERENYGNYLRLLNEREEDTARWRNHIMQWAHQMKTPVSVIRLMVQGDSGQIDPFGIQCELDRLQNQLDLMLALARSESFENDLVVEEVRPAELAEDAVRENRRLFVQHDVFPELDLDRGILVRSDRKWLSFAIEQVLHNAVKYSAGGSRVQVRLRQAGTRPELSVRDHGSGIRERDLPRIFELYYTGSNGREGGQSSGIGLYLVKRALDELGHSIAVESAPGRGTTVRILL